MAMLLLKSREYVGSTPIKLLNREPQDDFPEHYHDFSELVLVSSGSGIHVKNDSQKVILPNSVTNITEMDYHLYTNTHHVNLCNICYKKEQLTLSGEAVDVVKKMEQWHSDIMLTQSSFERIFSIANLIKEEQAKDQVGSERMIALLFEQLLLNINRFDMRYLGDNLVIQAIIYICDNYKDRDLSVSEVCENLDVSPVKLNHTLTELTGLSANRFINLLRITKAKRLLAKGLSVTDVAFQVGFNDSNYFSTKFRSLVGVAPTTLIKHKAP